MKWGMKTKVPVQYVWVGRAAPCPLPPAPLAELLGGGGGAGWRARSSLGILSREGGTSGKQAASWNERFFWRVNSAGYSREWIRQVATARYFGRSFWRIYLQVVLAHLFGEFSQLMKQASFKAKERKEKKCTISRSVNCIVNIVYSQ